MNLLHPKEYVNSIFDIDLERLWNVGIRYLIIDVEETLIPKETWEFSRGVLGWIAKIKERGFKIILITNSIYKRRLKKIGVLLDVPTIYLAMKPLPFSFKYALARLKAKPDEAVVIGDQLFTDILGGNILNIYTVLVKPLSRDKLWIRRLMRGLEEKFLMQSL